MQVDVDVSILVFGMQFPGPHIVSVTQSWFLANIVSNSCSVFKTASLAECGDAAARMKVGGVTDVSVRPIEVAHDNTSLCSNCLSRSAGD